MTQEELDKIIEQHQHWLREDVDGWEEMRANLYGSDITGANLYGSDITGANLTGANLTGANLTRANLTGANLTRADITGANLYGSDITGANLTGANLTRANQFRLGKVLTEPLTGYKKTKEGVIITAEIPAGAIVFCINGSKCRTNRAKITDMDGHEVLHSSYDNTFEYRLGQEINIKDFNLMYNVECASGFHFFRTMKEAEEYE